MGLSFIPDIKVESVLNIVPDILLDRGISLLLLDLDNTLVPYSGGHPTRELFVWKNQLEEAGIRLFIVSNTKSDRARKFAESFGISFIHRARKPFSAGILQVLKSCGKTKKQTALVGDQIFTDILGANLSGITSIVVRPLVLKNPLFALRYFAEIPFRHLSKSEVD